EYLISPACLKCQLRRTCNRHDLVELHGDRDNYASRVRAVCGCGCDVRNRWRGVIHRVGLVGSGFNIGKSVTSQIGNHHTGTKVQADNAVEGSQITARNGDSEGPGGDRSGRSAGGGKRSVVMDNKVSGAKPCDRFAKGDLEHQVISVGKLTRRSISRKGSDGRCGLVDVVGLAAGIWRIGNIMGQARVVGKIEA